MSDTSTASASAAGTMIPAPNHDVINQARPLVDFNPYDGDNALRDAIVRENAAWAEDELSSLGAHVGTERFIELGELANVHQPKLHAFDRYGHRINEVRFHPAYHELMATSIRHGLHSQPWTDDRPGSWVARLAKCYLVTQVEQGHGCPITMTFASIPALRWQPELHDQWFGKITSREYDPRNVPADQKSGVTVGMFMTEKQGGSDVRANTTRAIRDGDGWRLVGHKWFCSAPMCDVFLTLAHTDKGLSCFLLPRWQPDGTRNRFAIQRLKDKLGNKSNASSEIEYNGAWAQLVGEEGRGVRTIIEMVAHTRLDCVMGSAAVMRAAVAQAYWHAAHRKAFGKRLIEQPLMRNLLADLALEVEASLAIALRLGRAYDEGKNDEHSAALARIATPASKYHVCKRATNLVYEALEVHGGNGFVEEAPMARLFREAPLNSVWEGSGNVMCLDVLRAMMREPAAVEALGVEMNRTIGSDKRYDNFVTKLFADLRDGSNMEMRARDLVERIAVALQASVLMQGSSEAVADLFIASRLDGNHGRHYGTLPVSSGIDEIVERAMPAAVAAS